MPSPSDLKEWCAEGNLDGIRDFYEIEFPLLPPEGRTAYCTHTEKSCHDAHIPCRAMTRQLAIVAAEADQVDVFAYLWDMDLAKEDAEVEIPWAALKAAARFGSIPLAEAFYCRDPKCFSRAVLKDSNGRVLGGSQIKTALLKDHLHYVDFLLIHGAHINAEFPGQSPVRAAVVSVADEGEAIPPRTVRGKEIN